MVKKPDAKKKKVLEKTNSSTKRKVVKALTQILEGVIAGLIVELIVNAIHELSCGEFSPRPPLGMN